MPNCHKYRNADMLAPIADNLNLYDHDRSVRKSLCSLQPSASDPSLLVGSCGSVIKRKELPKKAENLVSPLRKNEMKRNTNSQENSASASFKMRRSKRTLTSQNIEVYRKPASNIVENANKSFTREQATFKKHSNKFTSKLRARESCDSEDKKLSAFVKPEVHVLVSSVQNSATKNNLEVNEILLNISESGSKIKPHEVNQDKVNCESEEVHTIVSSCKQIPKDLHDLLINREVTESYWKLLAEQRRIALEKALHENELLHDQLEVLEAENMQLNLMVKEAEQFVVTVKDMIGGT